MKTAVTIAASLMGANIHLAKAGDRINNLTTCAEAAKAFDTGDPAAVREVSIYTLSLFSQFSENVGDDPGIVKMVDKYLVAIVIARCRKFPERRLEYQTRLVFSDWKTKTDFWDERFR
jgi:hypothetical protein